MGRGRRDGRGKRRGLTDTEEKEKGGSLRVAQVGGGKAGLERILRAGKEKTSGDPEKGVAV